MYNILNQKELDELKIKEPQRFQYLVEGGVYLNLKGLDLKPIEGIDVSRIENLCRIVRGYAFAAINGVKSGHPGGSSSKVEQVLTLLMAGVLAFDPMNTKNPGRDRIVWSAGDAKLFFVFSLLIPISYYSKSYLPVFPSFALLVNIFIPILLFLIFASCFYLLRLKAYRFKTLKLLVAGEKNWLGLFRKLIHFYVGREEKEGRGEFYQCLFEWLNQPPLWAKKNHPKKNLCEYANQFSFLDFIIFILFFQGMKSPPV